MDKAMEIWVKAEYACAQHELASDGDQAAAQVIREALDAQEAENRRLREALRQCRQAISHGRDEPRRNVREIVDEALSPTSEDQPC